MEDNYFLKFQYNLGLPFPYEELNMNNSML